ncbi:polypeptide N-acetylgalactosaminyltransferase 3-like [Mya arenaria]|uniref:polypeptide N-acetylgalactosaminyltransferase 3-like n=1 Tax=Mya arenaria TaxID=6604 RepID=UPI0022DFCA0C|nr:polypeptide N-acetylgalactosaminyltransferase 3-like [Mya arenaria]
MHDVQMEMSSNGIDMNGTFQQNKLSLSEIYKKMNTSIDVTKRIRYGPGEGGIRVDIGKLNISLQQFKANNDKHRFNTFISDLVSLRRKIMDIRPADCQKIEYPDDLPQIGVVIIFRDEWPSILLRTVYSVLQMTPEILLKEIILVDDGSKDIELRLKVAIHAKALEKVRIVRHETSRGLMMARQSGIAAVTARYFAVLDGHMEVGTKWAEPLLHRLVQEPNALLCSHVGRIDKDDFHFELSTNDPYDLQFDDHFPFFDQVTLDQRWTFYSDDFRQKRNQSVAPIPYAVIQGMMMVMRKEFFMSIGGFDPGMRIWGSEQIDISVKTWLCGGRVEMVPCSTVGHMFRITPWGGFTKENDFHSRNKIRFARVWLDPPYSELFEDYVSTRNVTVGDLSERMSIRRRNKCKPYQYFVNVIKSISDVYIPRDIKRKGQIKNRASKLCFDLAKENEKYTLIQYSCYAVSPPNQYFIFTPTGQIRSIEGNTVSVVIKNDTVKVEAVVRQVDRGENGTKWIYEPDGSIRSEDFANLCITATNERSPMLTKCDGSLAQSWIFGKKRDAAVAKP